MEFVGIQFIGVIFGIGLLYMIFINFKRNEFTPKEFAGWAAVGLVFVVISAFPSVINPLARAINLTRPLDLGIILGFIFLIGVLFYIYSVMRATQKKLETMVSRLALEKRDDKSRRKGNTK